MFLISHLINPFCFDVLRWDFHFIDLLVLKRRAQLPFQAGYQQKREMLKSQTLFIIGFKLRCLLLNRDQQFTLYWGDNTNFVLSWQKYNPGRANLNSNLTYEPILQVLESVVLDHSQDDKEVPDDDHQDDQEANDEETGGLCWGVVLTELDHSGQVGHLQGVCQDWKG